MIRKRNLSWTMMLVGFIKGIGGKILKWTVKLLKLAHVIKDIRWIKHLRDAVGLIFMFKKIN